MKTARNFADGSKEAVMVDCQVAADGTPTPTLTKQAFQEECDINVIVRRFGLTGQLPVGVRMPQFGDFSEVTDFHEALNAVRVAEESFLAMPAEVRARFGNDPGQFVDFVADDRNRDEAVKLGLVERPLPAPVKPEVAPAAVPAPVAPEAPPGPPVTP